MKSFSLLLLFLPLSLLAQKTGTIRGYVREAASNKAVEFANVLLEGTATGAQTFEDGSFEILQVPTGLYNIKVSCVGYKPKTVFEVDVQSSKPVQLEIEVEPTQQELKEVEVKSKKNPFTKQEESPLSVRTIGVNEIQRYPGGNRDISKVIQALPGVGFGPSFRNDILVRGGSPSENRFYIDGIEIPNINHFVTQGASGGPVGMINVDFIREVNFYSGAFPSNRGNMLSSVMDIRMREGREDRFGLNGTLGSSDFALSAEGPIGKQKKVNFIASVRVSYLQWLFKVLKLPFLPTYTDFQYKVKYKIDQKNDLTFIGLGALDFFNINTSANETESQRFLLGILPTQNQWNYTIGFRYNHYFSNQTLSVVFSRNMLNNDVYKYKDNNKDSLQTLEYVSQESENKLRLEMTGGKGAWKYNYGVGYELARYTNRSVVQSVSPWTGDIFNIDYSTKIFVQKWNVFGQLSRTLWNDRLLLSLGLRADGSDYNKSMMSTWQQLSPRFSASVSIMEGLRFNCNTGYYHQLPPYTSLGFRDNSQMLVNKKSLTYIRNVHAVAGLEYAHKFNGRVSVEGFFKQYYNYPFIVNDPTYDSVNMANLGGDFGVVGVYEVQSNKKGRTYGLEVLYEQKLFKGWFGILSYTLFKSEFEDKNNRLVPSAWDTRHLISLTAGKKFKKGWEVGLRFRATGGQPYTPVDTLYSSRIPVWQVYRQGILDYDKINTERLSWFHNLDIRVSKKFFFKKWSAEMYLDVQNVYAWKSEQPEIFNVLYDANNQPLVNTSDPSRYQYHFIENKIGQPIPSVGVVIYY